jgi:predicted transcriptional regulator
LNKNSPLEVTENDSFHPQFLKTFPETNEQTIERMTQILSILSKNDALSLFVLAKNGIKSELDTPRKLSLTKKQYYSRLKQLVDLGLINKEQNEYVFTVLGSMIFQKYISNLIKDIENSKQIEIVETLKSNPRFSNQDISNFLSKVGYKEPVEEILDFASESNGQMITKFDEMVSKVLQVIEFAQYEILMATRFSSELIINSILKKSNAGIKVRVLADTNLVEEYFEAENKIGYKDSNTKEREKVVSDPYYPSKIQRNYIQIPYCILIVDDKKVGIEMVDVNNPTKFNGAIFVEDVNLSSKMKESFENLWVNSSPNMPQAKKVSQR